MVKRKGNAKVVKQMNTQLILDLIRQHGPISRAGLVELSKISAPSVSNIVEDLMKMRLVLEEGPGESSGGRPPILLSFNSNVGCFVAANIGHSQVDIAVADLNGLIRHETTLYVKNIPAGITLLDSLLDAMDRSVTAAGYTRKHVKSISVGVSGVVNSGAGIVVRSRKHGWKNVCLQAAIESRWRVPTQIENDVNLAAVGEKWRGVADRVDNLVLIWIGEGLGAGIIIDGKLYRGASDLAGEISHLVTDSIALEGGYGDVGYLQTIAGGAALTESARQFLDKDGEADSSLQKEELEAWQVLGAAGKGDPLAVKVVEAYAKTLALGIANVISILNPEIVVIGGDAPLAGRALLDPLKRWMWPLVSNMPTINYSKLGAKAVIYGGIAVCLRHSERLLIQEREVV